MHLGSSFTQVEVQKLLEGDGFVLGTPSYLAEMRRRFQPIADRLCCVTHQKTPQYREREDWSEPFKVDDYHDDGTLKLEIQVVLAQVVSD